MLPFWKTDDMRTSLVLVVASIALAGCGHKKHARVTPPPPRRRAPVVVQPGDTETGIASWYGHPYHGRAAANGEIYDMEKMTAAHRTLPFNTWVRVYDLDNNKTTEVRIIDRGPFVDGRIIDLSHAAAREIEMIGPGVAQVRIEVIRAPPNVTPGAVRRPGGRLPRSGQRRSACAAAWRRATARRACCSAPRIPACGGSWWARSPPKTRPASWPNASGKILLRKLPASSYELIR